jgi:nitrile hydratase subunit alpha
MSAGHSHQAPESEAKKLTPEQNKAREIRSKAIESLLTDKGLVSSEILDRVMNTYENDLGPMNGAKVVARAWVDSAYKERLLKDGTAAIAELGFGGLQGEHLAVVENTPKVHNVVVCTLCSCYPWPVLGLPPFWYKSTAYRSRVAGRPRVVLREFGLDLDESVEILVWNSSAETRRMVLPERPSGTEHMSEGELANLVTRDAMIGVARVSVREKAVNRASNSPIADMAGEVALPRKSGDLVFQDPWEGCVFALAVALCEQGHYKWDEFRNRLVAEIASAEHNQAGSTYYERWLAAFETLLAEKSFLTKEEMEARTAQLTKSLLTPRSRSLSERL